VSDVFCILVLLVRIARDEHRFWQASTSKAYNNNFLDEQAQATKSQNLTSRVVDEQARA
jgi:hypothetical protein